MAYIKKKLNSKHPFFVNRQLITLIHKISRNMATTLFQRYVSDRFLPSLQGPLLSYQWKEDGILNINVNHRFLEGYQPSPAVQPLSTEECYTLRCQFVFERGYEKIEFRGHQGVAEMIALAMVRHLNLFLQNKERIAYLMLTSVLDQHEEYYDHSSPVHKYLFDLLITKEICTFLDLETDIEGRIAFWYSPYVHLYAPRALKWI